MKEIIKTCSNHFKIGIFILVLSTFSLLTSSTPASAAFPRTPVPGIYTRDLTIYRTVNTLSCHPQNPLLHEIPHYVMYNPTFNGSGACWAYHNEGNTNFLMVEAGAPGLAGSEDINGSRPASPTHHYMVMELPNPNYNPANEADCKAGRLGAQHCGKYVHWEGFSFMFQMAVDIRDKEVWYIKNFLGGYDIQGRNVSEERPAGSIKLNVQGLPDPNGRDVSLYVGTLTESPNNHIHWKCGGSATSDGPVRPGDANRPCFDVTFDITEVANPVFSNALLFSDIPHNRFTRNPRNVAADGDSPAHTVREWFDDDDVMPGNDHLLDQKDDDWVKCQSNGTFDRLFNMSYRDYIKKYKRFIADPFANNIAVSPYTPDGCDYNPINQDPGAIGGDPAAFPSTLAHKLSLTNKWVSAGVTVTPQNTPTPTQGSGPIYLRSDFGGGPGGARDEIVSIQDLNILYSEFYRTDLPTLRANIATAGQSSTVVDIQDYSLFTTDYRAYLDAQQ